MPTHRTYDTDSTLGSAVNTINSAIGTINSVTGGDLPAVSSRGFAQLGRSLENAIPT